MEIRFGDTRELLWADHFEGLAPALAFICHCGFPPLCRWLECRDPLELAVELLLGVPQVIGLLHADPQIGTVAARSDIVGGLITLKYVRRQAKRQFLHPTHLLLHPPGPGEPPTSRQTTVMRGDLVGLALAIRDTPGNQAFSSTSRSARRGFHHLDHSPRLQPGMRPNAETLLREYLIDAEVRDNSGVTDHVAFASRGFESTKQHLMSRSA